MRLALFTILFILSPVLIADDSTVVYVLRHAEKTKAPKNDPVLTEQGALRANNLSNLLCDAYIDAVFSTNYARTRLTVKPLADCLKTDIRIYDPSDPEGLAKTVISEFDRGSVVIVGHSNTVGEIMRNFGFAYAKELTEADYGDLFKLVVDGKSAVSIEQGKY